jgi:hypothetical protein
MKKYFYELFPFGLARKNRKQKTDNRKRKIKNGEKKKKKAKSGNAAIIR